MPEETLAERLRRERQEARRREEIRRSQEPSALTRLGQRIGGFTGYSDIVSPPPAPPPYGSQDERFFVPGQGQTPPSIVVAPPEVGDRGAGLLPSPVERGPEPPGPPPSPVPAYRAPPPRRPVTGAAAPPPAAPVLTDEEQALADQGAYYDPGRGAWTRFIQDIAHIFGREGGVPGAVEAPGGYFIPESRRGDVQPMGEKPKGGPEPGEKPKGEPEPDLSGFNEEEQTLIKMGAYYDPTIGGWVYRPEGSPDRYRYEHPGAPLGAGTRGGAVPQATVLPGTLRGRFDLLE